MISSSPYTSICIAFVMNRSYVAKFKENYYNFRFHIRIEDEFSRTAILNCLMFHIGINKQDENANESLVNSGKCQKKYIKYD